jgi:WD40 repeat protein
MYGYWRSYYAASGVVSFVSLSTQRVYCELQAHSRFLSAMDLHPWRDVFATVAEDSTVGVWALPKESGGGGGEPAGAGAGVVVRSLFATCWRDGMLTGVAFCGDRGDSLAVCAHDEVELCVWQ